MNREKPPLLLVAPVAHGRSLLAGVFLVAVLARRVIGLFELDDLAFRLGLVALMASLFLALLVLVVALLAVLGPAGGVRLVIENDPLLGLLHVLGGRGRLSASWARVPPGPPPSARGAATPCSSRHSGRSSPWGSAPRRKRSW